MKWLTILSVVLLVVFTGCVGNGATPTATPDDGSPTPDAGTPTPTGATPTTTPKVTPSPTGKLPTDLSGLGYVGLAALGAAVDCTIKIQDSEAGKIQDVKLKMLGNKARIETEAEGQPIVMVVKDNKNYMQLGSSYADFSTDCEWLIFEPKATGTGASDMTKGTVGITDIEDLPATQFTCTLGAFGNEAFDTPGKTCTLGDMLGGMLSI